MELVFWCLGGTGFKPVPQKNKKEVRKTGGSKGVACDPCHHI